MQGFSKELIRHNQTIGFVPTMGFLHEGHLSLVDQSTNACDVTVMSIFVNPLQFGPNEDFERYPRNIEQDIELARRAGVDFLFCPTVDDLYQKELPVTMTATKRTNVLCGASRPGHFDGVVSVLTVLFNIVQPQKAFFGRKDAQQVAVVQGLVDAYHFPIEVIAVDTVREEDGLAKSSRNVYLTDEERQQAPMLSRALNNAAEALSDKSIEQTIEDMNSFLKETTSGKIDYIQILHYPELEPVVEKKGKIIIALAVQFAYARLIDNIVLTLKEEK